MNKLFNTSPIPRINGGGGYPNLNNVMEAILHGGFCGL